ncbi:hypothetical protein IFM89_011031 [Coptis chinensis]|uniref:Plastocyanin-like domain-containing protein n=1 Tax=Coptis chinensis TaxID=261450 RepID=A0A835ILR2_9MAGN|nr:hypothetical protein IFM89_011031 [Coptis chinensis]
MEEATGLVKHELMAKFKDEITQDQIDQLIKGYAKLVTLIKPMKSFHWYISISLVNLFSDLDEINGKVMKFIIRPERVVDTSRVPVKLTKYPRPDTSTVSNARYIAMYEYTSSTDEPTHLYLNGKSYEEPVTETPKTGTTELWNVINLTKDNHPLHVHLGLFVALEQRKLVNVDVFRQ